MKAIATIALMLMAFEGAGQNADTTRYKPYADSTGQYVIKYVYDSGAAIPAPYPEGKEHYNAVVTVFEIEGSDTTQVYQPLRGVYVEGECACYQPAKTIQRYKELQKAEQ